MEKAKDDKAKESRTKLAAELGELTLQRAKLVEQLNRINTRSNQIAVAMEKGKTV